MTRHKRSQESFRDAIATDERCIKTRNTFFRKVHSDLKWFFLITMILGERKVTREVRSSLYKKRTNTNAPRKNNAN